MKKSIFLTVLFLLSFLTVTTQAQSQVLPYLNPSLTFEQRVNDLLSSLTVEEKVSLLIASSPGIPKMNIDKYYHGNEALHGAVRAGNFTLFPQAIALASMWNPELQYKIATVISDENRARWNELEQGKTAFVNTDLDKAQLRFRDENMSDLVTPKGEYIIMVGASSEDIRLSQNLEIWSTLGPKLQGKIWIWTGDMDRLYSNIATRFLKTFLDNTEKPKSDAKINFTPMANHCQEWSDEAVLEMIVKKIEEH